MTDTKVQVNAAVRKTNAFKNSLTATREDSIGTKEKSLEECQNCSENGKETLGYRPKDEITLSSEDELIKAYFGKTSSEMCRTLRKLIKMIDIADLSEVRLMEIALKAKKNELTKKKSEIDIKKTKPSDTKKSYYQKKVRDGAYYWNVRYTLNGKTITKHLENGLPLDKIDPTTTIVSFHPDYLKDKGIF